MGSGRLTAMGLRRIAFIALLVMGLLCPMALGAGLRSVGVGVILPIGKTPFLFGVEATTELSFGLATGSFFLASGGKTLIVASCDVRLAGSPHVGGTFLRLTTGLLYFDPTAFLPSVLFGGGLAVEAPISSALAICASGEFVYPLAFSPPLVSASGRWVLP